MKLGIQSKSLEFESASSFAYFGGLLYTFPNEIFSTAKITKKLINPNKNRIGIP